jgi:hypothetical protein
VGEGKHVDGRAKGYGFGFESGDENEGNGKGKEKSVYVDAGEADAVSIDHKDKVKGNMQCCNNAFSTARSRWISNVKVWSLYCSQGRLIGPIQSLFPMSVIPDVEGNIS